MGFLDDLFDFDGDGKVGLFDNLMFLGVLNSASEDEKKRRSATPSGGINHDLLAARAQEEEVARKRKAEAEALRKAQHELNDLRHELYAVPIAYTKDKCPEAITQYNDLLSRLSILTPEDTNSVFYIECITLRQEIKNFRSSAESILNGKLNLDPDSAAWKATDIAQLERELADWEMSEPEDSLSEVWDTWEERRAEYEEQIETLKEDLVLTIDDEEEKNQAYLNLYADSTKVVEKATPAAERLERLVRMAHQILEKSVKMASEQCDSLARVISDWEYDEPDTGSPKWEAWRKRLDEMQDLYERLERIADLYWDTVD